MKKVVRKNQIIITALAVMIVVAGYLNFTGQEISTSGLKQTKQEVSSENKDDSETAAQTEALKENAKAENSSSAKGDAKDSSEETKETAATGKSDDASSDSKKTKTDISAEDIGNDSYTVGDNGEIASQDNPGEAVMVSNTIGADYFASAKLSREQTRAKNKETLMEIINNESLDSGDKKAAVKEVAELTSNSEKESAAELMLEAKGFSEAMVSISDGNVDVVVNVDELSAKQMAQIEDIVKRKTGISGENIVINPVSVKK